MPSPESSGAAGIAVVEPGSKDDPFTEKGTQDLAATAEPEPTVSQPDETKLTPEEQAALDAELAGVIEAKVQERLRAIQSGADKRVASVEKDLRELRSALRQSQREAQVAGMTADEKATFKDRFALEDERDVIKTQKEAVDEYRKAVEMLRLVTVFEKYGVTQDLLEACETPEEMELLAERTRADFLEKGGKPGAPLTKKSPAGAAAKTDLGGAPGAEDTGKLSLEQGVGHLAGNIRNLFGKPGNVN